MQFTKSFLLVFFLFVFSLVKSQVPGSAEDAQVMKLRQDFDSLKALKNDDLKRKLNEQIITELQILLKNPQSFQYGLDSLKTLGKISAPDNSFRILNWNLSFNDFSYSYINFMQYNPSGKFGYRLVQIKDTRPKIDPTIQTKEFTRENWYGALIYKILLDSYKHRNYYTFFAIDNNNMMSKFKFIDVITFDEKGEPVSGNLFSKRLKR